jgi:branched-chain amino acid transport system ATP-binding protein
MEPEGEAKPALRILARGLLMLQIKEIVKNFGGVHALRNVSFGVKKGEFVGLIGPNGSGKTTLFNVISGAYKPTSGHVIFEGHDITALTPNRICHSGITRTFQIPRPIKGMSILDNVLLGLVFGNAERPKKHVREAMKDEAEKLIDFVGLKLDKNAMPDKITAVDLRKLELAKALATKPRLLLADEILSGLNHDELGEASTVLKKIREEMGITIIWVEHILSVLMSLVDRVVVFDYGQLIADGTPQSISNDASVLEAYLG